MREGEKERGRKELVRSGSERKTLYDKDIT